MNKYTINTIQISLSIFFLCILFFYITPYIFQLTLFRTNEFNDLELNIFEADIIYFI
jgi:hypothetical protein